MCPQLELRNIPSQLSVFQGSKLSDKPSEFITVTVKNLKTKIKKQHNVIICKTTESFDQYEISIKF